MHTRSALFFAALTLLGVAPSVLGCSRGEYSPAPSTAHKANPPPLEMPSNAHATQPTTRTNEGEQQQTTTTNAPAAPPPAAGTSTPTPSTEKPPYKPGSDATPPIGGGPKPETSGAVHGDENEGNTGAPKGGDGSKP